jgi:hypothetical protein
MICRSYQIFRISCHLFAPAFRLVLSEKVVQRFFKEALDNSEGEKSHEFDFTPAGGGTF